MFKRPPLRLATSLVNAPLTLSVLFLFVGCGGPSSTAPETAPRPAQQAVNPDTDKAPDTPDTGLSLPAVWQTAPLEGEITSIGIADAAGSTLAVSYKDGGVQLFNFEGERLTQTASLNADIIANGRYLLLQNTPVTLFPALSREGELTSYIHGGVLDAPLEYPLDSGLGETLIGLCSAPPLSEADGLMRIGFWSLEQPDRLQTGRLLEVRDALIVLLDTPIQADGDIVACVLHETGAHTFSAPVTHALILEHRSRTRLITLNGKGRYDLIDANGKTTPISVRDGLSFKVPEHPVAMAGTADARGGGYPNGLIVVGGQTPRGNQTVTFIDPSLLQP